MKERRGILNLFKGLKKDQTQTYSTFKELNAFQAYFGAFGNDIYQSDEVRACIEALAEHTSKANPRCTDKRIERLLSINPNKYMNGKDMLAKLRNILEVKNTAFLYIERDDIGRVIGFYPVPYQTATAVEYKNGLFIQFQFLGTAANRLTIPWEDLAVLRKNFLNSDIFGEGNAPLFNTLDIINTLDRGAANAVKSTANLRGVLKSTKAMLNPEDVKKQKEQFVQDYMNINNSGGIASLDATQEFKEINMKPATATAEERKEYSERVYRYYGVNERILKSNYTESDYDAFYESRIEPFLVALSLELTRKIFTERELAHETNRIWYESNRLQYASARTKIAMVSLVDRALMTPNEYRELFNLAPYEGGDEFILRLDTAKTADSTEEEPKEEENDNV